MKMPQAERKTVLDNGVRILTKQMPHVHSVSMGIWVNAGARDETPLESGLCHLIEHMLFKGTPKRTAFQIAKEFDAIGGQSNAFTSMENTCCHARVMDTHLATMVDILSDIFLNSCFHEDEYEKERPVILQEIGMLEDNPDDFIHVLLGRTFWGSQSLGQSVLGTRENLLRFDVSAIKDFFRKFNQPDRILIAASGNLAHDRFVELAAPAFEAIPQGDPLPERSSSFNSSDAIFYAKEIEQAHINIGLRGLSMTDPDRYALNLLNTILGGNMSSRLFQEIRERRGLAYSVYSFISSYADAGMFGAYAAVEPGQAPETVGLIVKEMRRLKETKVDQAALQDAKEYTKGNLMLASESVDNQMARLAQNEFNLGRFVSLEEIMEEIDKVTAVDIQRLAEALFQPSPSALAILGPVTDKAAVRDAFVI